MGSHPLNLAFRFLLELALLITAGAWGWNTGDEWVRFVLALGVPVSMAAIWGIFAVPDDPSRSGNAPIATNGLLRLIIELCLFGSGVWMLYDMGKSSLCIVMASCVIIHYALSYDRISWLLKR